MTLTNAISAVTVVGGIIGVATTEVGSTGFIICFIAIVLASINMVGGFLVVMSMLEMFRSKDDIKGGKK